MFCVAAALMLALTLAAATAAATVLFCCLPLELLGPSFCVIKRSCRLDSMRELDRVMDDWF